MRKGISFTLTIIITAVVLMTAALTLVTLFGSSVGSFFGTISETGVDARVRQKCSTVVRRVNDRCSDYYATADTIEDGSETQPGDSSSFRNPPEFVNTCNDLSCGVSTNAENQIMLDVEGNRDRKSVV